MVLEYIIQRGAAFRERGAALGVLIDARKAWVMGVDCSLRPSRGARAGPVADGLVRGCCL